jgi:hypothetical protein
LNDGACVPNTTLCDAFQTKIDAPNRCPTQAPTPLPTTSSSSTTTTPTLIFSSTSDALLSNVSSFVTTDNAVSPPTVTHILAVLGQSTDSRIVLQSESSTILPFWAILTIAIVGGVVVIATIVVGVVFVCRKNNNNNNDNNDDDYNGVNTNRKLNCM